MAMKTQKSPLLKYAAQADAAVVEHANDETKIGGMRIPGGINYGVAQLEEIGFSTIGEKSQDNMGKLAFSAMAVVIEPEFIMKDGQKIKVAGLQTRIWRPVEPTKDKDGKIQGSWGENLQVVMNDLRLLGGEDFTADATTLVDLDAKVAILKEIKPYFRFNTTESPAQPPKYPNARVWENWQGIKGLEGYQPKDNDDIQDDTSTHTPAARPSRNGAPQQAATEETQEEFNEVDNEQLQTEEAESSEEEGESVDWSELATAADDDNDKKAAKKIKDAAIAAGVSEEAIGDAKNWAEVVGLMEAEMGSETGESEEADEPEERPDPAKGEVWMYKDPATKKLVNVTVQATYGKTSKADIKGNKSGKVYKGIPWSQLEPVET